MDNMVYLGVFDTVIDFIVNVATSLFSSLVWAIVAFVAVLIYNKLSTWYYNKKFYKTTRLTLKNKKDKFNIQCFIANSGKYDGDEKVYLGYPFEYMAAATINSYLELAIKNIDMNTKPCPMQVNTITKIDKTTDLILLGGPFHNVLTKMFFGLNKENSNVPFYFDTFEGEDATLFYKENPNGDYKAVKPIKDPIGHYYCEDYGLIMNIKNPYNPNKRIISIMGCRSIGVLGGTIAFTSMNKEILKNVEYDEYAVIIRCFGEQNNISNERKIEKVTTIKLDSIKLEDLIEIRDREEITIN